MQPLHVAGLLSRSMTSDANITLTAAEARNQVPVGGSASFTNWVAGIAAVAVVGAVTLWYVSEEADVTQKDEIPAQVELAAPAPQVP